MPGVLWSEASTWDPTQFEENFRVEFHQNEPGQAVFSLVGLDPSIANAFRRILLSEIPTLAFCDVTISQNTSVVQDEVLAHRIGLIPLRGSKQGLRWMQWKRQASEDLPQPDGPTDRNTVRFVMQVDCIWRDHGKELSKQGESDPHKLYHNAHIYARDLIFMPVGRQSEIFSEDEGPLQPVNPDILLAKLRPGQTIEFEAYACKGIGQDHAKFSPVATASYRLLPEISILKPIVGADADKFAKCFPDGVIALQKITKQEAKTKGSGLEGHEGELQAVVKDPFKDTVTRECLRHEEFQDKVKLGRKKDHFIFSVESTGQFDSDELFLDAVKVLREKCAKLKEDVRELKANG